MPFFGPPMPPVKSPRRGGRFVSRLPDLLGIRCPWDVAAAIVADDEKCGRVAEATGISFIRRDSGLPSQLPLSAAARLSPDALDLVRVPSAHVGMPNYIGVLVVPDGAHGRRGVWFESFNEMHHLLDIMITRRAASIVTQPLRLEWRFAGRGVREHTPDILVRHDDDRILLVDVTRADKVAKDPALLTVLALTAETCRRLGWGYEVRTELPPQRCRNLRALAGYLPDEQVRAHDSTVCLPVRDRVRLGDIASLTGGAPPSREAILRALAAGTVHVDLDQPIDRWSFLHASPPDDRPSWMVAL